ncbi:MAG: aspartate aminotransferase family protein [Burkholderiales bacterium]|jgi:beta-alanine--pyruvate transaminase|nr:aspartate aminotransferase family protein [Burkholderiales bacterium]
MNIRDLVPEQLSDLNLDPLWLPFTANRAFKQQPRLFTSAKGMYYRDIAGREILDGIAGLWAVNAGHCRESIVDAIRKQAENVDYVTGFQVHNPAAFVAAERLVRITPPGMGHVFYVNSGSEAVDTALKIALAYHRARGQGTRTKLIGRERGYHGVGFGGISVGGMVANRKVFGGNLLPNVDHLPHTHDLSKNAFSRGQPAHGANLADELERLVQLHDASNIAAVIVEPVAGSTGVLIPPQGYLQRLRDICTKHGILLIFDEVITGFGRTGNAFASQTFGVTPDLITCAKALTNAAVPMGAVVVKNEIYDTFMDPNAGAGIEFFHGYTYSGHPLAAAASIATLDLFAEEGLFERCASLSQYWEDAAHSLRGLPHVIDVRNIGLIAGIELESIPGKPGARAWEAFLRAYDMGVLIRAPGDTIALSPPLIVEKPQIDRMFETLHTVLKDLP